MFEAFLSWLFPPQCGGCNAAGTGLCLACLPDAEPRETRTPTLEVAALAGYGGAVRRAILALKDGRRDVALAMGQRLGALVPAGSILVPVPTTPARRAVRGFDGAQVVAATAAKVAGAHVRPVLTQVAGDAQRGRNRPARLAARGRFACEDDLEGAVVILVDDVLTTGSTLEDCAATLRYAGAFIRHAIVIAVREHESDLERHGPGAERRNQGG